MRRLAPLHFQRLLAAFLAEVFTLDAVGGAEQIFEEVLVALAGRTEQIGAPHEQIAREINRIIRIFKREVDLAGLELFGQIRGRRLPGSLGVLHQLERIGVEMRRRRQPAHPGGAHVVVDLRTLPLLGIDQRRENLGHGDLLVPPLAGVDIEKRGGIHVPGRAVPVQRKGQRRPAGLGPQLFLTDIMRPAAAALTDAAAHHQHIDDAPVIHIHVIPVIHRRADDDHRLAVGLIGIFGELAGDGDDLGAGYAGNFFLPGWGVRHVIVIGFSNVAAAQTPIQTILRQGQVIDRGDQRLGTISQPDLFGRHITDLNLVVTGAGKVRMLG